VTDPAGSGEHPAPRGPSLAGVSCRLGADRETPLTAEVGHTGDEVVREHHAYDLRHYAADPDRHRTPILLVYALVNRPYVLDLQPDRSVVRRLTGAGFDVYLVDWNEPTRVDRWLTLSDYVTPFLDDCVRAVCDREGVGAVHLLGYCMGGTMATVYAALEGKRVRTLGLLAAPIAFEGRGGVLERWADRLDPGAVVEAVGNVPAEVLAAAFALLDPAGQLRKYARLYDRRDDDAFVATFARMERWVWDGVDVAGEAFREFVTAFYRENRLVEGRYELDGRPVRLADVESPVLAVVGAEDHIVPPAATRPVLEAVGSTDTRLVEFPRGHIGLSVSERAHAELWPAVAGWFARRDGSADGGERRATPGERVAEVAATARGAAGAVMDRRAETAPPVGTVRGVGPTYADRLRAAGVETVADLAAREPAALAEIAEAPVGRVHNWLERAR